MKMVGEAGVVVIGAGAFGTSVAFHLAQRHVREVVLMDKADIGTQTTPRAAGLTAALRSSDLMSRVALDSIRAFERFEQEVGEPLGFRQVGAVKVALTPAREALLHQDVKRAKRLGIPTDFVSPSELKRLVPVFEPAGVRAATWTACDGYIDEPARLPLGYARAAEKLGVRLVPRTAVTRILWDGRRITGVGTNHGEVLAPVVVNTAGAWAGALAETVGVRLAMVPIRHQLYITHPLPGLNADQAVLRVHDASVYTRYAGGGLMVGGYESDPLSVDAGRFPADFEIKDLSLDFGVLKRLTDRVLAFYPILREAAAREHRGGLPTVTPDGEHLLGSVPGLEGFYVAAGCCVGGLSVAPTIGRLLAELITEGKSLLNLSPLSPARFGGRYADGEELRRQCEQVYAHHYAVEGGRI
jgi:4-methylaminobutanoate oxidase (formaldehyde-forming)